MNAALGLLAVLVLTAGTTVAEAVERLRRRRSSLAVVRDGQDALTGLVSLDDLLARLMGPQTA
ncbi:CBS domain-containing protein [Streptomyces sp. NPDC007872]|uniref:CBS domain-containing protein n=1 Tax=Streptomyces sp. NPDC007872 TaxID=3364782 RepID=UPI0036BB61E8